MLLLLASISVHAQEEDESESITPVKVDSPAVSQQEVFDVNGTKVLADSNLAMGSDTVLKADTTSVKGKKHTAIRAVFLSAVCPGLGQAYNKKYWKIPIIYAGFGGLTYALYYTSHNYYQARAVYRLLVRNVFSYSNGQPVQYLGYSDAEDVKYFRDQYKNYLNISALVTVVWYGLQLIDAAVDGHLFSYNMDDKLSFNFDPSFLLQNPLGMSQTSMGLAFTLKLGSGRHKAVSFVQ
jgi:hypothetical protein